MTLKTSLLITGDSSVAKKAVDDLGRAVDQLGERGKGAAAGLAAQDRAQAAATTSARELGRAGTEAAQGAAALGSAAGQASGALGAIAASAGTSAGAVAGATGKLREHSKAINDNDQEAKRHAAGVRQLGQQFGDLAVMIQGGIDPARAFATQAGQMGYAMSEMSGKAGAVGRFLVGPWGIALTVAVAALAPFAQKLLETAEAAEQVELASNGLTAAQGALGTIFDLTTGKLLKQNAALGQSNELLRINARLAAINLRTEAAAEAASSARTFDNAGRVSIGDRLTAALTTPGDLVNAFRGLSNGTERGAQNARNLAGLVDSVRSGRVSGEEVLRSTPKLDFTGTKVSREDFQKAIRDAVSSKLKLQAADFTDRALDTGVLPDALRRDGRAPRQKKSNAAALAEFGLDAAGRISSIREQFDDTPPIVRQVAQAKRQLDDLMRELEAKKPKGFEQLIASAREAKSAIEAGLNRPLEDFLDGQREQLRQGALIVQGRTLEAEAAARIVAIERQQGPLTADQRQQVLATVVALREQERQIERVQAAQQVNLTALQDMRAIVAQTIYEGPESLVQLPARVFDSFKKFAAEKLTQQYFDPIFRDIRDDVLGATGVDKATRTIVSSFKEAAQSADALAGRLSAAAGGSAAIAGGAPVAPAGASDSAFGQAIALAANAALDKVMPASSQSAASVQTASPDIVVTGRRPAADVYGSTVTGILRTLGVGAKSGEDAKARDAAALIGKNAGSAMAGAFEGQAAAGVASMLGIKTSSTGAAIGGAIGSFLPIPGGSFIGGTIGGILGGLLGGSKPAPSGTATVTEGSIDKRGTSDALANAAGSLGGQVQSAITSIVEQLGGTLGKYDLVIGTYDGKYRVRDTSAGWNGQGGLNFKGMSGVGLKDFGEDQGAALAYAVANAIADGAVTGLSAAVTKALKSSTDVDKALAEAVKVQDLELLLGGFSATAEKAFREFEATAKERLRIARDYGFDVLAIEKRNAEDRKALLDELTRSQTGSLQQLVAEMTSGSLFEGTAMERITALNAEIAKAQADLTAGKDGAADTLAQLYQQRLEASKAAYGTTGEYAADRSATIAEAQLAIARVSQQVAAAQAKTDPALATTNAALDENNDQNAKAIALLEEHSALLRQLAAKAIGGGRIDLSSLAGV